MPSSGQTRKTGINSAGKTQAFIAFLNLAKLNNLSSLLVLKASYAFPKQIKG
jgi:hypothetical protein